MNPTLSTSIGRAVAVVLALVGLSGGGLLVASSSSENVSKAVPPAGQIAVLSAQRAPQILRLAVARQRLSGVVADQLGAETLSSALAKSCVVIDAADGLAFSRNADLAVLPASTQKILTATSALARLAPSTTFRTEVRSTAPPTGTTLNGDLWIVGGGDPLLETADYTKTQKHESSLATRFDDLVDQIVKSGLTTITGSIVGDGRRFDNEGRVKTWKRSYVRAGEVGVISGLMVDDNFTVVNAKKQRVAAADAPVDAARLFQAMLAVRGVTVLGEPRSPTAKERSAELEVPNIVAKVESRPIADIVGEMLLWSDNTTAEMLLKEVGRSTGSFPAAGSWTLGLQNVERSLRLAGVSRKGIHLVDGSGLDVSNRVTCRTLLDTIKSHPSTSAFFAGLPVMGRTGTLRSRLRNTDAQGKVRAKTGTLNGVSSLAGTADAADGSTVAFSMVFNGLSSTGDGVAVADAIISALVKFPDAPPLRQFHPGLPNP